MTETNQGSIFNIDMHIHTSRYSECAESLDPQQVEEYALNAGLDALVITEHDTLWERDEFYEFQEKFNQIQLFNGVEVSTENGYHLVLIGIEEMGPLQKGIGCNEAIEYAHAQGGIVILAHPFRKGLPSTRIIEQVDGIEVGSTSMYENETKLSLHLADVLRKSAIASSDAHALSMIGWAYTAFPKKPENKQQLCTMIKEGVGKPILPNPFFG